MDIRLFINNLANRYAYYAGYPHPLAEEISSEIKRVSEDSPRDLNREIIYSCADGALTLLLPTALEFFGVSKTAAALRDIRHSLYLHSPDLEKIQETSASRQRGVYGDTYAILNKIGDAAKYWREEVEEIESSKAAEKFKNVSNSSGILRSFIQTICAAENQAEEDLKINQDVDTYDTFFIIDSTGNVYAVNNNYWTPGCNINDIIDSFLFIVPKRTKKKILKDLSVIIYELWGKYKKHTYHNYILNNFFYSMGFKAKFYTKSPLTLEERLGVLKKIIAAVDEALASTDERTKYKIENSIQEAKNKLSRYAVSDADISAATSEFGKISGRIIDLADDPHTVIAILTRTAEEI